MEIENDIELELFYKIKKIPYIKLIESYIKDYNEDKLALMAMEYLAAMTEKYQVEVVKTIERQLHSSFTLKQFDADCENALIIFLQTSGMRDIANKYINRKLNEEENRFLMLFFRVISFTHAHLASKNKELRKLLGIRKGLFFKKNTLSNKKKLLIAYLACLLMSFIYVPQYIYYEGKKIRWPYIFIWEDQSPIAYIDIGKLFVTIGILTIVFAIIIILLPKKETI